jgi:hypothetical protein
VVAGQFGAWTPFGSEQTATGYEVAWKTPGADQYTVWNTDSSGNFVSNNIGVVSGTSNALESLETSFHQDLNGDGVIGVPQVSATVIESLGLTSLVAVGSNFYLNSISSGSGPELKYQGATVVAGQFGAWTPFGTEQTATGYEVAWKTPGADQYTVWNTDNSGSFVSNNIGPVSGTSSALESLEASFHQDLNGDGVIGISGTPSGGAPSSSLLQTVSSSTAGLDTFVFRPDMRTDPILSAASADTFEPDGFLWPTSKAQLAAPLIDAQTDHSQTLHDTVIDPGNHDSITLMRAYIGDSHAGNFIIH